MTPLRTVSAALAVMLSACVAHVPPAPSVPTPDFKPPSQVYLLTEGAVIEAEEDTWSLASGSPVTPPFLSELWMMEDGVGGLLNEFEDAINAGAMRVRVTVPQEETPLYGVLALLPVADSATSIPAKRTYRMLIPPERVTQAKGGLISVTYQPYTYKYQCAVYDSHANAYRLDETVSDDVPSWVLWLSDTPF